MSKTIIKKRGRPPLKKRGRPPSKDIAKRNLKKRVKSGDEISMPRFPEIDLKRTIPKSIDEIIFRTVDQDVVHNYAGAMDAKDFKPVKFAMDTSYEGFFNAGGNLVNGTPALFNWYAAQGFIGYQMAAILSQHYLIDKACSMPAEDAVRVGFETTIDDGTDVSPEIIDAMRKADVDYNLDKHMVEFVRKGRIYGIRILMFKIVGVDQKTFYENPFNIDGIPEHSYQGMVQIDPYWITPELDQEAAGNPASLHFYEPTWWRVGIIRIHRTHLVIMRNGDVPDILKPTYFYGGIPVPQKIYERVYNAERTANEAPMLAMTKRLLTIALDTTQAIANPKQFQRQMDFFSYMRDNYGVKTIGLDDTVQQFDTSLADLDDVIMTQYQLVAAASNVPATKLLGTSPKGFNASGSYEEKSYHEELESIQAHELTKLVMRHHQLLIKSKIAPEFGVAPFSTMVRWRPLSSLTAKEQAEINHLNASTAERYVNIGATDGRDERERIINDPSSGYTGLDISDLPEQPLGEPDEGATQSLIEGEPDVETE